MPESPTSSITEEEDYRAYPSDEEAEGEQGSDESLIDRIALNNAKEYLKRSVKSIIESIFDDHGIEFSDESVTRLAESIANPLFPNLQEQLIQGQLTEEQLESLVNPFIQAVIHHLQPTTQQEETNYEDYAVDSEDEHSNSGESVLLEPNGASAESEGEQEDIDDSTPNQNPELTPPSTDEFALSDEDSSSSDNSLHLSTTSAENEDSVPLLADLVPPHAVGFFI